MDDLLVAYKKVQSDVINLKEKIQKVKMSLINNQASNYYSGSEEYRKK